MPGGSTCIPICGVSDGRVVPLAGPPAGLEDLADLAAPGFTGRLICVGETDSTNRLALSLAAQLRHGDALLADAQTAGRGRQGRVWLSPRGGNIYLTFALRPAFDPSLLPGLTLVAAIALADAVDPLAGGGVTVRWPNDLLIGGRKAAGILAQTAPEEGGRFVALGIGVNLVDPEGGFPEGLRTPATSIGAEAGRPVPRGAILARFLPGFARLYDRFAAGGLGPLVAARPALFPFLGAPIMIDRDGRICDGTAVGIGANGALVIRSDDGRTTEILAGEVVAGRPEKEGG